MQPKSNNVDSPYVLHFEDGSTHEADAVIGCDGVRSKVRQFVLGTEGQPRFGGYWDARGMLTPSRAAEQFGTQIFDPTKPESVGLVGPGAVMLFYPTVDQEQYHVIVSAVAGPNYDNSAWKTSLNKEFLEESYQD